MILNQRKDCCASIILLADAARKTRGAPSYNVNLLCHALSSLGEQRRQQALRLMAAHQRLVDNESMRRYQNYDYRRLNTTDEGAA